MGLMEGETLFRPRRSCCGFGLAKDSSPRLASRRRHLLDNGTDRRRTFAQLRLNLYSYVERASCNIVPREREFLTSDDAKITGT